MKINSFLLAAIAALSTTVLAQAQGAACLDKEKNIVNLTKGCPPCYDYMTKAQVENDKKAVIDLIYSKYPPGGDRQWGHWFIENGTLSMGGEGYNWSTSMDPKHMNTVASLCTLKPRGGSSGGDKNSAKWFNVCIGKNEIKSITIGDPDNNGRPLSVIMFRDSSFAINHKKPDFHPGNEDLSSNGTDAVGFTCTDPNKKAVKAWAYIGKKAVDLADCKLIPFCFAQTFGIGGNPCDNGWRSACLEEAIPARRGASDQACYHGHVFNQEKGRCMTADGKCEQGWKSENGTCVLAK